MRVWILKFFFPFFLMGLFSYLSILLSQDIKSRCGFYQEDVLTLVKWKHSVRTRGEDVYGLMCIVYLGEDKEEENTSTCVWHTNSAVEDKLCEASTTQPGIKTKAVPSVSVPFSWDPTLGERHVNGSQLPTTPGHSYFPFNLHFSI